MSYGGAALTDEEKTKIRYHLGYNPAVQQAQSFVLGIPAGIQTTFMIEGAMNRVLVSALPEVRRHLAILERFENQMLDDAELLAVEQVDEIHVRKDEQEALWKLYYRWVRSLAGLFGVVPNPFDGRLKGQSINVPVVH
jgi:hypothetical protein